MCLYSSYYIRRNGASEWELDIQDAGGKNKAKKGMERKSARNNTTVMFFQSVRQNFVEWLMIRFVGVNARYGIIPSSLPPARFHHCHRAPPPPSLSHSCHHNLWKIRWVKVPEQWIKCAKNIVGLFSKYCQQCRKKQNTVLKKGRRISTNFTSTPRRNRAAHTIYNVN